MNWNLIWWFFGAMATFAALKFIVVFFRSLFSKDTMKSALDAIGDKVTEANETLTEKIKERAAERKKKKEEENRAYVIIR